MGNTRVASGGSGSVTGSTGTSGATTVNIAVYYALAYIMKS
jgi:hypothetical protein